MKPSAIAEFVLKSLMNHSHGGVSNRLWYAAFSKVRSVLARKRTRFVRYDLDGTELLVPLGHDMPLYRRSHIDYSNNIGRLASYVAAKYDKLTVVDIGANVGDTAAIIRARCQAPILCIEGDEFYFELLQNNIDRSQMRDVQRCHAFVGTSDIDMRGGLQRQAGTASFVANSSQSVTPLRLSEILCHYPIFESAKLLKIDTDGFDCQILNSELEWLARAKPVTFIEYDPYFNERQGYDARRVFRDLQGIGYRLCVVWDNTGEYLLTAELANASLLEDLHVYYSGRYGSKYADIAFVHEEDFDLGLEIRQSEVSYFQNRANNALSGFSR
jgi:FkbM family methyltransferase